MKRQLWALALAASLSAGVSARMVEGVDVAEKSDVGGKPVVLNGTAVGKATFLGIKCWAGGFYAPRRVATAEEAEAARPLRFDFTFIRDISRKQNVNAWTAYFKEFSGRRYPGLEEDLKPFYAKLEAFKSGTMQTLMIDGDESRFYQGGALVYTFKGENFQKNFLSLWFGGLPAQKDVKNGFLSVKK